MAKRVGNDVTVADLASERGFRGRRCGYLMFTTHYRRSST